MDEGGSGEGRPMRHRPAPVRPVVDKQNGSFDGNLSRAGPSRLSEGAMPAIYNDPAVEELCRIETFKEGFNARDFLAGLSDRLIARSRADPGPFNPRPFIRSFEAAVEQLQSIRKDVEEEQSSLASSAQVAQSAYSSKLHELASHFTSVSQSFSSLESRFSEVSRTAISIGEQLESIDRQKQRAVEAHDLIEHYYAFARGDTHKLDRLRKEGGREGRLKTATIARRLGAISREVDMPGAEQTRETVDRYNERFERDMLRLFDKFYRKSDPKMMSHIARVLQNFNGGQSCIQIYVNQHDFFISKDRVGDAGRIESSPLWQTVADPDALPPQSEAALASLFHEIRTTVGQEAQIITAVFPNPMQVMSTFLQRVFAQSVQSYIEILMSKGAEVSAIGFKGPSAALAAAQPPPENVATLSDLAFLRVLQMARTMSLALISDLKVYDLRGTGGSNSKVDTSPSLGLLNGDAGSGDNLVGASANNNPLAFMLDSAVEEIFVPYMEGNKYIEREAKSLTELYATYLLRFTAIHKNVSKIKTSTIFDRVRAAAGGAASPLGGTPPPTSSSNSQLTPSGSASAPSKSTSAFSKLSGFVDRARGATPIPVAPANGTNDDSMDAGATNDSINVATPTADQNAEDGDGELTLSVAERMLRWHAEGIGRCVDLSNPSDVGKNIFILFKVLADAVLKSYIEVALDSALTQATMQDVKSANLPDVSPMRVVRQVEFITALWQHYVTVALMPLAGGSVTLRREMTTFNSHNLLRMEGKCDALVQRMVDNILAYLSNRLATQKRNDFAPKNDELAFSRLNTDPCIACCDALERIAKYVRMYLSSKNAETVLTEIGVAFHSLLLDHFKKYTVSAAGGLMITKDLALYQDSIALFGIASLNDRFEMLRSLGNLFIVQPSVIKGYMREGHLSKIDERLLQPFLLRRSDYAKEVRDLEAAMGNVSLFGPGLGLQGGGPRPSVDIARPAVGQGANTAETYGGLRPEPDEATTGRDRSGRLSMMLSDLEKYAAGQGQVQSPAIVADDA